MMKQSGQTPGTEHIERGYGGEVNEMESKEARGFGNDRHTLSWPEM